MNFSDPDKRRMHFMLQIIPVIDIRGGIVVHARGGNRQNYPVLKSVLTPSAEPAEVISDLLAWLPFPCIYIADLDAIEQRCQQESFYRELCRQFPQTAFWLDSGIKRAHEVAAYDDISNLQLVVGSETLVETEMLMQADSASRLILSLDKKKETNLGNGELFSQPKWWTRKMILMNLDRVGADQGPDLQWLRTLLSQSQAVDWYLAGGIRNEADLIQAQRTGAKGVLIASALHTGALSKASLKRLLKK
jgi:phosphoribosylformimino-5-aminoimidazole carboxamide ribotide isomerase